ncbi:MAG: hypothetical protein ACI4XL_12455 [Bacillus sp. (in: firmicutes)]
MLKKLIYLITLVILLSGCGQSGEKSEKGEWTIEPTVITEQVENLDFAIEVNYADIESAKEQVKTFTDGTYQLGEPIKIKAQVTNTGDKDLEFGGVPCDGQLSISLYNADMKAEGTGDITPDACIQTYVDHVLKAGETLTATAEFSLKEGIDLHAVEPDQMTKQLQEGTYSVRAEYAKQAVEGTIKLVKPAK